MKLKILISILLFSVMCISCASHRTGYRPPKRKNKDCDCPRWSYTPVNQYIHITKPFFA